MAKLIRVFKFKLFAWLGLYFVVVALICVRADAAVSETDVKLMKHVIFGDFETKKVTEVIDVSQNPAAQALVDEGFREILKSELARDPFCFFGQTEKLAVFNFAISKRMAAELASTCKAKQTKFEIAKLPEQLELVFPRNIVFVRSTEPARVESWTSQTGTIFIFSTDLTDRYKLVRTLIHEYFVGFDELYAFSGNSKYYLEHSDFSARGKKEDVEKYVKAFGIPLIRGTFQMTRTLYFENQILAEVVGQTTPTHRGTACWKIAKAVAVDLLDLQDLFVGAYALIGTSEERLGAWGGKQDLSIFDDLIALEKKAKTRGSLCELLSRPVLGFSSAALSNGPRPRIGSGTQRTIPNLEDKANVLQRESVKLLNRELPFSFPQDQVRPLAPIKVKLALPVGKIE